MGPELIWSNRVIGSKDHSPDTGVENVKAHIKKQFSNCAHKHVVISKIQ